MFEKEEGYIFLHQLFEQAIVSNRNKPVLFDPDYVFVSSFGDRFAFVVVPIQISNWMFQKDMSEKWVAPPPWNTQNTSQKQCRLQPLLKFLDFY